MEASSRRPGRVHGQGTLFCVAMAALVCLVALAWCVSLVSAQAERCTQKASVRVETDVYARPPTFYTGEGWKLGVVVGHVKPPQSVLICEEAQVGLFGLGGKSWVRIRTQDGISGWIFKEKLAAHLDRHDQPVFRSLVLVAQANAAANSGEADTGLPESGYGFFYVIIFAVILVGMVAKTLFDELEEASVSWRRALRALSRAMLVSPMVAYALLQGGNYAFTGPLSYWLALFLAFQNGFFWQTVLRPSKS